jgi:hypothetical protein
MSSATLPLLMMKDMVKEVIIMMIMLIPSTLSMECWVHDDKYHKEFHEEWYVMRRVSLRGKYMVHLPDGRIQHVIYHADGHYGGTTMEVKYSGQAHHPDYHQDSHEHS